MSDVSQQCKPALIGESEVQGHGVESPFGELCLGLGCRFRNHTLNALLPKNALDQVGYIGIVLTDQYPAGLRLRSWFCPVTHRVRSGHCRGEIEEKRGALTGRRFKADAAATTFNNRFRNGETQTGTTDTTRVR